ncbi:YebC/PmpR family DNA-binding transcriptional regulator [Verrucomicrobia bacterium]|nr:YebC/PmpR family DNA-binding transcriptional regulator [Verrucomicrobiota bacterium]
MGRQWLQKHREINSLKKTKTIGKMVKEIMIAAKAGGPDPDSNASLVSALEKARRNSVPKDAIERAIKKGAGIGDEKMEIENITFEGYTPHNVPVIVEVLTDNSNRTTPEMRVLFKKGQLGNSGSNKFLFDHVGLVEAYHTDGSLDLEEAAIEAGADDVKPLDSMANDDIPEDAHGARFITGRTAVHAVSKELVKSGWKVVTSELGYLPKNFTTVTDEQMEVVGEFLQTLEDHDDVHRIYAALP